MNVRRSFLIPFVLFAVLVLSPSVCFAALSGRIVEGKGVKTATLGLRDTTAAGRIGKSLPRLTDKSYAGQTVYLYRFGKKSGGKYELQMYSHGNRKVFTFIIYGTSLKTANGSRVGISATSLTGRYGSKLKKLSGPVYTQYYMGSRAGRTEFWVRGGKVHHIVIARY